VSRQPLQHLAETAVLALQPPQPAQRLHPVDALKGPSLVILVGQERKQLQRKQGGGQVGQPRALPVPCARLGLPLLVPLDGEH
jgi:hypothetical protein